MSNDHSKPAPQGLSSYPLIGREHLTEDQAADVLKQARLDEKIMALKIINIKMTSRICFAPLIIL